MKYAILSVIMFIISATSANAQVAAMFTHSTHNGVSGIYFEAQNTLDVAYPISYRCVKARNGAWIVNSTIVHPSGFIWFGPDVGWEWEDGDYISIMYPDGTERVWVYNE